MGLKEANKPLVNFGFTMIDEHTLLIPSKDKVQKGPIIDKYLQTSNAVTRQQSKAIDQELVPQIENVDSETDIPIQQIEINPNLNEIRDIPQIKSVNLPFFREFNKL